MFLTVHCFCVLCLKKSLGKSSPDPKKKTADTKETQTAQPLERKEKLGPAKKLEKKKDLRNKKT